VVPKVCPADPLGSTTISQRFRGCTSVMANMKLMYFFNEKNDVLLKITEEVFQLVVCLFHMTVRISNQEVSCTHEARDSCFN